jgi:hypothetical protein
MCVPHSHSQLFYLALLSTIQRNIGHLKELANSWLNTGHYKEVPDRLRQLYAFICAQQAKLDFLREDFVVITGFTFIFLWRFPQISQTALRNCDDGLLKGNDLEDGSLSKFASILCQHFLPAPAAIEQRGMEVGAFMIL